MDDHLNRPIKMTDSTKATVWDAVWAPWGNAYSITGTASLDARLPGQWFHAGGEVISTPTLGSPNHATINGVTGSQLERIFTPTIRNPNK